MAHGPKTCRHPQTVGRVSLQSLILIGRRVVFDGSNSPRQVGFMSPTFVSGKKNLNIENNPFLSCSRHWAAAYSFEDFPVIQKLPDCQHHV